MLCTREDLPFPIERLRGQGQVLEIDASMLSFSNEETSGVVDSFAPELASRIQDSDRRLAGGRPARGGPAARTCATTNARGAVDKLTSERGPLFRYLAEEVVEREPPELVHLLQTAALFETFSGDLCEALGVGEVVESLAELERRGFVTTSSDREDFLRLHDLLRDFLREIRPLAELRAPCRSPRGRKVVRETRLVPGSARRMGRHRRAGGDRPPDSAKADRTSSMRGRGDAIIAAANRFPEALLVPEVKLLGCQCRVRAGKPGDGAPVLLRALGRRGQTTLGPSTRGGLRSRCDAFHVADYEIQNGDVRKAVELFLGPGAAIRSASPSSRAHTWRSASCHGPASAPPAP